MTYYTDVLDLIGSKPLIKLTGITDMSVCAKAEFLNPGGSIKDRVAKHIIFEATKRGDLRPGQLIVEATSGNTGIGVTLVAIQRGGLHEKGESHAALPSSSAAANGT